MALDSNPLHVQTGVKLTDKDEQARNAVKAFRALQPTLTAYARILTKRPDVRVEMAAQDNGSTDGKRIFFRPPIALGDKTPHVRSLCDKRDTEMQMRCPACKIREGILVTIYHEIAHICFDSFAPPRHEDLTKMVERAVSEHGSVYAKKLEDKLNNMPPYMKSSFKDLASLISPFLPIIVNALEDARVNSAQFKARRGTKVMFEAHERDIFLKGVEQVNPTTGETIKVMWNTYPLNMQVIVGLFCKASGYDYSDFFVPQVVKALDDAELTKLVNQMHTVRNAAGVYHLSFPILARLRELGYCKSDTDPEPEPEPTPEPEPEQQDDDQGEEPPSEESESSDEGSASSGKPGDSSDDAAQDQADSDADSSTDGDSELDEGSSDSEDGTDEDQQSAGSGETGEEEVHDGDEQDDDFGAGLGEDADQEGASGGTPSDDADQQGESGSDGGQDDAGDSDAEPDPAGEGGSGQGGSSEQGQPNGGDDDSDTPAGTEAEGVGHAGSKEGDLGEEDAPSEGVDEAGTEGDGAEPADGSGAPGHSGGEGDPSGDGDEEPGQEGGSGEDSDGPEVGTGSEQQRDGEGGSEAEGERAGDAAPEEHEAEADASGGDAGEAGDAEPDGRAAGDEPIDSGADDGTGGVEIVGPEPEMGEPEVVSLQVLEWMEHAEKPKHVQAQETQDEKAVDVAIIQGLYFETPSKRVTAVREHRWNEPVYVDGVNSSIAWSHDHWRRIENYRTALGIEGDYSVPESILGPALLRARVAFSENQRGKDMRHLKGGKVDPSVLGKRAFHGDERLFKRRIMPGKRNYFVLIGMDVSGSTIGENILLEKKAVMAQAQLLNRMGIQFGIYAHTGNWASPKSYGRDGEIAMDIFLVKEPDEPWNSKTEERLRELGPASTNIDGHTLEYYRKVLDRVDATDKVIMYYTDGKMPAENHDEELEILRREIKICKRKNYTLMGVGIRTDSPVKHGLDTVQVDGMEDIVKVVKHLEKRLIQH